MSKFLQFTDAETGREACIPKDSVATFSGSHGGVTKIVMGIRHSSGEFIPSADPGDTLLAMQTVDEIHNRMRG